MINRVVENGIYLVKKLIVKQPEGNYLPKSPVLLTKGGKSQMELGIHFLLLLITLPAIGAQLVTLFRESGLQNFLLLTMLLTTAYMYNELDHVDHLIYIPTVVDGSCSHFGIIADTGFITYAFYLVNPGLYHRNNSGQHYWIGS